MAKYTETSFYRDAKIKDFYLDVLEFDPILPSYYDSEYEIEARYENRPDLLSYDFYGTVDYWWVIVLRNLDVIEDPLFDFTSGKTIYLPRKEDIE